MYVYSVPKLRETAQRCQADKNTGIFSARMKVFCNSSGACSEDSGLFQVVGKLIHSSRKLLVNVGLHSW